MDFFISILWILRDLFIPMAEPVVVTHDTSLEKEIEIPDHGLPFPQGSEVRLRKLYLDSMANKMEWELNELFVALDKENPEGRDFVLFCFRKVCSKDYFLPETKIIEVQKMVNRGLKNPLALMVFAHLVPCDRVSGLLGCLKKIDLSQYNHEKEMLELLWHGALAGQTDKSEDRSNHAVQCLRLIVKVLQDSRYQGEEFQRFLCEYFIVTARQVKPINKAVSEEELQGSALQDHVKELILGEYCRRHAWDARGGGWGYTVKEEGWKVYGEYMEKAGGYLKASWAKKPDWPYAPNAMLDVASGRGAQESLRTWFDRGVRAEYDYAPLYNRYLWFIRPRWGGNLDKMFAFGQECLNTGRFDTLVPSIFLESISDMASEYQYQRGPQYDDSDVYRRPGVYEGLQEFIAGRNRCNDPWDIEHAGEFMLFKAAWGMGKCEEALALLESFPLVFHAGKVKDFGVRTSILNTELSCAIGKYGPNFKRIAEARLKKNRVVELRELLSIDMGKIRETNLVAYYRHLMLRQDLGEDQGVNAQYMEWLGQRTGGETMIFKYRDYLIRKNSRHQGLEDLIITKCGSFQLEAALVIPFQYELRNTNNISEKILQDIGELYNKSSDSRKSEAGLTRAKLRLKLYVDDFLDKADINKLKGGKDSLDFVNPYLIETHIESRNSLSFYLNRSFVEQKVKQYERVAELENLLNRTPEDQLLSEAHKILESQGDIRTLLTLARILRTRGEPNLAQDCENTALDYIHGYAESTYWDSCTICQIVMSLESVEGYSAVAAEYGQILVKGCYCDSDFIMTANAMRRSGDVDGGVETFLASLNRRKDSGLFPVFNAASAKGVDAYRKVLLRQFMEDERLSVEQRNQLKTAFPKDLP